MFIFPSSIYAAEKLDYDLEVQGGNIYFSKGTLVSGDFARVYALVRNVGKKDMTAKVTFYQGQQKIGDSETVSIRANGLDDEVFVDWTVPNGAFNIRAELNNFSPQTDQNLSNNVAITPIIIPIKDDDKDGIINDEDNCPLAANADQKNTDNDTQGDVCDADDDNDGVLDVNDAFPLDSTKSKDTSIPKPTPKPKPQPAPTPTPDPVTPISDQNTTDKKEPLYCETDADCASVIDKEKSCDADARCVNHACELKCKEIIPFQNENPLDVLESETLSIVIDVTKQEWNRYLFTPVLGGKYGDRLSFAWDFGDGATSTFSGPVHTYRRWGSYVVTLNVRDNYGNNTVKSVELSISFFNPGNWMLWVIISILALFVLVVLWWHTNAILMKKKERIRVPIKEGEENLPHSKTSVKVKSE